MKRKHLLLTTFCLTATLLLSACGTKKDTPSESVPSQDSTAQESQTPENAVREVSSLPRVVITTQEEYRYAAGEEALLVESNIDRVELTGEGFEEASQTVESLFNGQNTNVDNLAAIAKEDYEYGKSNGSPYFSPYTIYSTCQIARLDESIFSMKRYSYEYTGGAHGYGAEYGTTIDLKTGEELELIDLAVDSYGLIDVCADYVLEKLSEREDELSEDYKTYISENLQNCNWYLDASGIEFVFAPYEIGPYSSGNIVVGVPYSQVAAYMKGEYCGLQGECVTMLQADTEASFVSGEFVRTLEFETRSTGEYVFNTVFVVDGKEYPLEDYVCVETAYLVRRPDDKVFLLYSVDWASDDYETYVYDMTGDEFVQTASVWARIDGKDIRPDALSLTFTLQVLGTHMADMAYILTEDGALEPEEEIFYDISSHSGWAGLTTIKELPVILEGEQTMLPVGTRLYVTATDNAGTVWFEIAAKNGDIQTGEIHYVRDAESYLITIDGVSEFDYFEALPYVG